MDAEKLHDWDENGGTLRTRQGEQAKQSRQDERDKQHNFDNVSSNVSITPQNRIDKSREHEQSNRRTSQDPPLGKLTLMCPKDSRIGTTPTRARSASSQPSRAWKKIKPSRELAGRMATAIRNQVRHQHHFQNGQGRGPHTQSHHMAEPRPLGWTKLQDHPTARCEARSRNARRPDCSMTSRISKQVCRQLCR